MTVYVKPKTFLKDYSLQEMKLLYLNAYPGVSFPTLVAQVLASVSSAALD